VSAKWEYRLVLALGVMVAIIVVTVVLVAMDGA
jgi:hypothetical protein